jgi:valyl-tRNA synthetase
METGRDLIFLWVTRMIMLGLYTQGKVPFKHVYFHGMVLDPKGKKMSKSKGNVVSPVDLVAKYGADAVRFGLVVGAAPGADLPMPEEKMVGGRNFANKVWNIARFTLLQIGERDPYAILRAEQPEGGVTGANILQAVQPRTEADSLILQQVGEVIRSVDNSLDRFRLAQALQDLHEFVWHQFADKYVEAAKQQTGGREEAGSLVDDHTAVILYAVLLTSLKLLHPFMPFVTESIYRQLPRESGLLMAASWPVKP